MTSKFRFITLNFSNYSYDVLSIIYFNVEEKQIFLRFYSMSAANFNDKHLKNNYFLWGPDNIFVSENQREQKSCKG